MPLIWTTEQYLLIPTALPLPNTCTDFFFWPTFFDANIQCSHTLNAKSFGRCTCGIWYQRRIKHLPLLWKKIGTPRLIVLFLIWKTNLAWKSKRWFWLNCQREENEQSLKKINLLLTTWQQLNQLITAEVLPTLPYSSSLTCWIGKGDIQYMLKVANQLTQRENSDGTAYMRLLKVASILVNIPPAFGVWN